MTPTTSSHADTTPIERPGWLPPSVWPFAINSLATAGHRIAYTDIGTGPILLFSHAGQWSLLWRDVIAELSRSFRCVAYDPPGSGLSDRVPAGVQTLDSVRDAVGALIDQLDLRDVTLVMHDLGGVTALAAASTRLDRIAGIAAVNTFGWRPTGLMFRSMLAVVGSGPMRELDAFTGFLPKATSRRFGVGRRWDRATRRAFRHGIKDRAARRTMHRLFRDARLNTTVYRQAEHAVSHLADRPTLTVFGSLGDYLGFQKQWRRVQPDVTQRVVPLAIHFPMCDNPRLTATHLATWHHTHLGGATPPS